jgi:Galactocerebrosidase, C-terminal lectin domain
MRKPLFLSVFLILVIGGSPMSPTSSAQSATTQIDLSGMKTGIAPEDFAFSRTGGGDVGEWRVVDDPTAGNGRVIAQTSKDTTDHRFPLAVYQRVSAKNVDVKMRFKPVDGKVDQAGGIVVRLTTPDDYYVVRANALEDNVRFYRVIKGRREPLKGANIKVTTNEWHTLELRAEGDRFTVSFDGKQLYTAQDNTFAGAGRVGLWTKADSVTYFDTIAITPLE